MTAKLCFLLLSFVLTVQQKQIMASAPTATEFNKQAALFAVDLYSHVIKNHENDNVVISPLSVHTALGLAYMGAGGKTKSEMSAVLRAPENKADAAGRFNHVLCKYQNSTMLSIANKVYVANGRQMNPNFLEASKNSFRSEAENIDFAKNSDAARTINSWVEGKTNKKIQNLIDAGSLDADTRMVLVNAIYFKGFWKNQFKKEATGKADFWISETESVKVDMMRNNKASYLYGELDDLDATAVELPFRDEDLSMLIILPNKRTGLGALEQKITSVDLPNLRKKLFKQDVIVSMPKFKIEFSIELSDVLGEMGMPSAFSNSADFSELLTSSEPLKISKVIHKAFIDVNEEGAEAAAATGLDVMMRSSFEPPEINFAVDRSFVLVLMGSDDEVLFIGRLTRNSPKSETSGSYKYIPNNLLNYIIIVFIVNKFI